MHQRVYLHNSNVVYTNIWEHSRDAALLRDILELMLMQFVHQIFCNSAVLTWGNECQRTIVPHHFPSFTHVQRPYNVWPKLVRERHSVRLSIN